eukprot:gene312-942_t
MAGSKMPNTKMLVWIVMVLLHDGLHTSLVEGVNIPKLDVSVSNENKKQIKTGESFWYSFTISHNASSSTDDAKNIQITWYMPSYIKYERLLTEDVGTNVEIKDNSIVFKKSALPQGSSMNVKFQVNLDNSSGISKGHHYAVNTLSIQWYSTLNIQYHHPLKSHTLHFIVPGCSDALGMTDGQIKSHQLIASSWLPSSRPEMARYSKDAWCAQTQDANPFIQVLFARKTRITRITTWGRQLKNHWVKSYSIQYSDDYVNWKTYMENGFEKIFTGNYDQHMEMSHWLLYPISANYLKINPKTWHTQICMRFELNGCQQSDKDNCLNPLGMESGRIPDEALSQSTPDSSGSFDPANARLNKIVSQYPNGWAPYDYTKKEWIQIDLGSVHKITRTAIQGAYSESTPQFFVKSYKLQYSNNSVTWSTVQDDNHYDKLFKGPETDASAVFPTPAFFLKPIHTRYLRLIPEEFSIVKSLRMEIYGCLAEEMPAQLNKVNITEFSRRNALYDSNNDIFYVCMFQGNTKESSCKSTKVGKIWKELDNKIVNIIGYNTVSNTLFGLNHDLSYMYSLDNGLTWLFMSNEEWFRRKAEQNTMKSTKLSDILVGKTPSITWTTKSGGNWGGQGVYLKTPGADWKLSASWKCCGH